MKILNVLGLFAVIFLSRNGFAVELSQVLELPEYVEKKYGKLDVKVDPNFAPQSSASISYRSASFGKGTSGVSHRRAEAIRFRLKLTRPIYTHYEMGKALFDMLSLEDSQMALAVRDLENMRIWNPEKGEYSVNLQDRVRDVFARKVARLDIRVGDEVALAWWRLKFEAEDPKTQPDPVRVGDPVLLVLHQTGYFSASGNFLIDLRRRLDFGHSALGIRFVGATPDQDILLNPGSKNRDFYEVALPNSADENVPNMVDVDNLWDWMETQIRLRFMSVDAEVLKLTRTQKELLPLILPRIKGLNFGPAIALTNNCADGAVALVNFILPIHRVFSAKTVANFSIPGYVSRKSRARFYDGTTFRFPDIADQNPFKETPGTSYKDQSFSEDELTSFKDFLKFEESILH